MGDYGCFYDLIVVELAPCPGKGDWAQTVAQMLDELETVAHTLRNRDDYDVIIDFSHVQVLPSACHSKLLKLKPILAQGGHRLVLCCVDKPMKDDYFADAGSHNFFEFAMSRDTALEFLGRHAGSIDQNTTLNNLESTEERTGIVWHNCGNCNTDVIIMSDGRCPNCKQDLRVTDN